MPELASLVDPTQTNPSLPPGHPFVNLWPNGFGFWTATTDSTYAYVFAYGVVCHKIAGAGSVVGATQPRGEFRDRASTKPHRQWSREPFQRSRRHEFGRPAIGHTVDGVIGR